VENEHRTKSPASASIRVARIATLAVFALSLAMSAFAQDAPSHYLSLDAPHPQNKSYVGTYPEAINRHGWIAGIVDYGGTMHGFLRRRNGTFIAVDVPGASQTTVWAINAYDEAVGDFLAPGCNSCGFLRDASGSITQLAIPGASTGALGINGSEVVVGTAKDTVGYHGFLWSAQNGFTVFDVPGTKPGGTLPVAINGTGTVIGYYFAAKGYPQGFVRSRGGRFTKFGAMAGGPITVPTAINATGQITGWTTDATGDTLGFLRDTDGTITTFSVSGMQATETTAINDSGVIVGFDFTDGNHPASFERDQTGNLNPLTIPFTNTYTRANGINLNGNVTGFYVDPAGVSHGWVKVP